jgi:hypothetical protein
MRRLVFTLQYPFIPLIQGNGYLILELITSFEEGSKRGYSESTITSTSNKNNFTLHFNPLTLELNPSAQRCLTRFFTADFASWTVHFVNKSQQIYQLLIQFINYVWQLLHISALHFHPQGAFLVPSERCSTEEQSSEYCGWADCATSL